MADIFPCKLSYCIEKEIEVVLECPFHSSLEVALDRFRADEERLGIGLKAILRTASAGMLSIGSNSRKDAACLGFADQAEVEAASPRYPRSKYVEGGPNPAGPAEFHLFFPDCPGYVSEYEVLPWPRVRELVLGFAASGLWPSDIKWFDYG